MGDRPFAQSGQQRLARAQRLARGQVQGGAAAQGHHHFPHAGVEAERGELQYAAARSVAEQRLLGRGEIAQAAVAIQYTLGLAGRAGRVDDVGEVVGGETGDAPVAGRAVSGLVSRFVGRFVAYFVAYFIGRFVGWRAGHVRGVEHQQRRQRRRQRRQLRRQRGLGQ